MFPSRWRRTLLILALAGLGSAPARAQAPGVRELRTQKVGNTTYFHVRFEAPKDLQLPRPDLRWTWWRVSKPELARLPQLVPQNGKTQAVYPRVNFGDRFGDPKNGPVRAGNPLVENLEFFGKVQGKGEAKLLLLYPTEAKEPAKDKGESYLLKIARQQGSWTEVEVALDWGKAKVVPVPEAGFKRDPREWPAANDLEGQWAASQGARFAVLEALTPEFGFYGFARETTGRKHKVPAPGLFDPWNRGLRDREFITSRMYEITTGAAAIAESLALHRLRNTDFRDKGQRTIDIGKIQGIDIAEHPWVKMMGKNKPAPEPLAKLVPQDNYYLHFKNIAKFLEAGDLMDQWGTSLSRAFEVNSRDNYLKDRLEKQLCLRSGQLARVFGPTVVKSLAITGSDPYLREGTDLTVIFHVKGKNVFLAAVDPYIEETRKQFKDLQESKSAHLKITIESYTTPLREVSLHRAIFDEYVVYSNSPAGLRRVLDVYKGKRKPLADSLDFQYMRTVFRLDDPQEDGFLFLSDAFIRNLVGPATRIKERRRLEGLTSLYMVTHAALYHGWETGKLPPHHNDLMAATGLKPEEIFAPDGNGAFWDGDKKLAISDVYNTLTFATPLIEIPIDKVTDNERQEYDRFRQQYLGLWRQFFDPIGMRLSLKGKEVRWETYILPLIQLTEYNRLRAIAGDGTLKLDPASISPKTLAQFFLHLSPKSEERRDVERQLRGFNKEIPGFNWLGDWVTLRIDDSPIYAKMVELLIRRELEPGNRGRFDFEEEARLFFQMPITVGVEIRNPLVFAGVLTFVKKEIQSNLPDSIDWAPMDPPYKGVTIVQIKAKNDLFGLIDGGNGKKKKDPFLPSLYYATVDGAWYISLRLEPIKDLIDRWDAKKKGKLPPSEPVEVNAALHVGPAAAVHSKDFLRLYLEWETHRRTLANNTLLYSLYRAGVLGPDSAKDEVKTATLRYLGFQPVSADNAPFVYDKKTDEMINQRHGSVRRPHLHAGVDPASPNGQLLEMFRAIRADLKFREDGVHTTITLQRQEKK